GGHLRIQQFFLNDSPGQAGENGGIHRSISIRSNILGDYSTASPCCTKWIVIKRRVAGQQLTKIVTSRHPGVVAPHTSTTAPTPNPHPPPVGTLQEPCGSTAPGANTCQIPSR